MSDIIIVGGGASGIMSAICAKIHKPELSVTVLEKSPKALKKLLATGNGRCNMLNCDISESNFHGSDSKGAFEIINKVGMPFLEDLFISFGLELSKRFSPLIYPASFQASSVREALLTAAYDRGVKIFTDFEITDIKAEEKGFLLTNKKGKPLTCKKLILSGGTSATSGSDSCSELLRSLGHTVNPHHCALVPLTCKETNVLKLANGARAYAKLTLICDGKKIKSDSGEVQFTDYGLSGIVTMQLSGDCTYFLEEGRDVKISLALFDDKIAIKEKLFADREFFKKISVYQRLCFMINSLICDALLTAAGVLKDKSLKDLTDLEIDKIAELLCDMHFTVTGSKGEKFAQVFGGGTPLCEFDESLRSNKFPDLYVTGELLDVYGDCGGYNLTWAWASGYTAGKNAALDLD